MGVPTEKTLLVTIVEGNAKGGLKELNRKETGLWSSGDIRTILLLKGNPAKDYILFGRNQDRIMLLAPTNQIKK